MEIEKPDDRTKYIVMQLLIDMSSQAIWGKSIWYRPQQGLPSQI
jgi:hypothetical protein